MRPRPLPSIAPAVSTPPRDYARVRVGRYPRPHVVVSGGGPSGRAEADIAVRLTDDGRI